MFHSCSKREYACNHNMDLIKLHYCLNELSWNGRKLLLEVSKFDVIKQGQGQQT